MKGRDQTFQKIKSIFSKGSLANAKKAIDVFSGGKAVTLYLVDQYSGDPVGKGYTIDTPGEVLPRILPLMETGLKVMKAAQGVGKLGRMFGLPTPCVPESWIEAGGDLINGLNGGDEGYQCVTEAAGLAVAGKEGNDRKTALSQFQARQFERFLKKHDPDDSWKDSLLRIATKDGQVLWVTEKSLDRIDAQGQLGNTLPDTVELPPEPQKLSCQDVMKAIDSQQNSVEVAQYGLKELIKFRESQLSTSVQEKDCDEFTEDLNTAAVQTTHDTNEERLLTLNTAAVQTADDSNEERLFTFTTEEPLGINFAGFVDKKSGKSFAIVKSIVPGSQAAAHAGLTMGLQLLKVGQSETLMETVQDMEFDDAIKLIKRISALKTGALILLFTSQQRHCAFALQQDTEKLNTATHISALPIQQDTEELNTATHISALTAMRAHKECAQVQESACLLLAKLSQETVFDAAEAVAAVLEAMAAHATSSDVQGYGCLMLGNVAEQLLRIHDGYAAVCKAAQTHSGNSEVQCRAVFALSIMVKNPQLSREMRLQGVELVLASLDLFVHLHSQPALSCQDAMKAIDSQQSSVEARHGLKELIKIRELFQTKEQQQQQHWAFARQQDTEELNTATHISALTAMRAHTECAQVQESACLLLAKLSQETVFDAAEAVAAVLEAMTAHATSSDVQGYGCLMLGNVAEQLLRIHDGYAAVCKAAQTHSGNSEVQCRAVFALSIMVKNPQLSREMRLQGVELVLASLDLYDNARIQLRGSQFLHSILMEESLLLQQKDPAEHCVTRVHLSSGIPPEPVSSSVYETQVACLTAFYAKYDPTKNTAPSCREIIDSRREAAESKGLSQESTWNDLCLTLAENYKTTEDPRTFAAPILAKASVSDRLAEPTASAPELEFQVTQQLLREAIVQKLWQQISTAMHKDCAYLRQCNESFSVNGEDTETLNQSQLAASIILMNCKLAGQLAQSYDQIYDHVTLSNVITMMLDAMVFANSQQINPSMGDQYFTEQVLHALHNVFSVLAQDRPLEQSCDLGKILNQVLATCQTYCEQASLKLHTNAIVLFAQLARKGVFETVLAVPYASRIMAHHPSFEFLQQQGLLLLSEVLVNSGDQPLVCAIENVVPALENHLTFEKNAPYALYRSSADIKAAITASISGRASWARVNPRWIPDNESATCMLCESSWSKKRRRHHCRRCGLLMCGSCSRKSGHVLYERQFDSDGVLQSGERFTLVNTYTDPTTGVILPKSKIRVCHSCYDSPLLNQWSQVWVTHGDSSDFPPMTMSRDPGTDTWGMTITQGGVIAALTSCATDEFWKNATADQVIGHRITKINGKQMNSLGDITLCLSNRALIDVNFTLAIPRLTEWSKLSVDVFNQVDPQGASAFISARSLEGFARSLEGVRPEKAYASWCQDLQRIQSDYLLSQQSSSSKAGQSAERRAGSDAGQVLRAEDAAGAAGAD